MHLWRGECEKTQEKMTNCNLSLKQTPPRAQRSSHPTPDTLTADMMRRTEVAQAAECVMHVPSSSCCSYVGKACSRFLFKGERWSHNDVLLDYYYFKKWLLLLYVGLTVLGFVAWYRDPQAVLLSIWREMNIKFTKSLPEKTGGRNVLSCPLCDQYHTDTKSRQK